VVPLGGDAVEGEAEGFGLAGGQRRDVEVDGLFVGAVGTNDAEREVFALGDLCHGVFEIDFDHDVGNGFVAGVGDVSVDVADGGSDEIFGGGHFEVRKFQIRNVGGRSFDWLGRLAQEERGGQSASDDHDYGDHDDHAAGVAFFGGGGLLAEGVHEGIVGWRISIVDFEAGNDVHHEGHEGRLTLGTFTTRLYLD